MINGRLIHIQDIVLMTRGIVRSRDLHLEVREGLGAHLARSVCQMILRKVAIPVGVNGQSYWEAMILGITNDKFCALRANFKQELFEQFQGKYARDLY